MTTLTLLRLSAGLEAATGVVLIAVPDLAAHALLGTGLREERSCLNSLAFPSFFLGT